MRNLESCSACSRALNVSHYAIIDGQLHKSCSLCSRVLGEHVFHKMSAFGTWHTANRETGRPFPQSECMAATQARLDSSNTAVADLPYSQLAGLLNTLPAAGASCPAVLVLTAANGEVAAMLEVLRTEAEEDLAARTPRQLCAAGSGGRSTAQTTLQSGRTSYANVRSLPPRAGHVVSSENYSAAEIQAHAAATTWTRPTVLRRRAGVTTPAQTGVV